MAGAAGDDDRPILSNEHSFNYFYLLLESIELPSVFFLKLDGLVSKQLTGGIFPMLFIL